MQVVGFWKRFGAYLIDSIITGILIFIISFVGIIPITGIGMAAESEGAIIGLTLLLYVAMLVLTMAYYIVLEASSMQGTIGKKVLGIIVVDEYGERITIKKSLGRSLSKFFLSGIFYIGYIMIAVTEKKQGLHDVIAKTYCVEKERHRI